MIFRTNLSTLNIGLMICGRARWQEAEATRKFQYCTDPLGQEILYLRSLHSGRNAIDPSLRDNVLIPNNFFEYIFSNWMFSQFTLHHKFRSDSGKTKFKQRETDGMLYSRESHA